MRVRVNVHHSSALAGYSDQRARLQIMPGEYEIEFSVIVGPSGNPKDQIAHFSGADTHTGKSLYVRREEYPELWDAPKGGKGKGWHAIKE